MNSSKASTTKQAMTLVEARRASTWIERYALPLAVSVMEAQPIGLLLILGAFVVTRKFTTSPISVGGIALLELGLLWWAMLVERLHLPQRLREARLRVGFHVLGWLITVGVTTGPHLSALSQGNDIAAALILAVLVTWLWRRSMSRSRTGMESHRSRSRTRSHLFVRSS